MLSPFGGTTDFGHEADLLVAGDPTLELFKPVSPQPAPPEILDASGLPMYAQGEIPEV